MRLDKCRTGSCCAGCCHMTLSAACPVTGREFAWKLACAPVSAGSLAYTDTPSNQPETLQRLHWQQPIQSTATHLSSHILRSRQCLGPKLLHWRWADVAGHILHMQPVCWCM